MYQLDLPIYLYALVIIPILWLGESMYSLWQKRRQTQLGGVELLDQLSPNRSKFKPRLKLFLLSIALLFLIGGLVNPKIGTELETVTREGIDLVFAVDVSKSMLAEDIAPNRLEKSKRLVSAIINRLASDRIGIIAYAAQAVPQLPITTDYGAAKMFLQGLNTEMLSSQGTAIDAALDLSATFFDDTEQTNKVVFLISDGEDHSEEGITAANRAAAAGITIFTLGVGTEAGSPIPIKKNGIVESYKKDLDGEVVVTKRNATMLQQIAEATTGAYQDGNNTQQVLDFVTEQLKDMDKQEFEAKKFVSYKDQFQAFLFASFLLILIERMVFSTQTKWIKKLNLFNEKSQMNS